MSGLKKEKIDKLLYAIAGGYVGYFVIHPIIMSISFAMQTGEVNLLLVLMTSFSYRMIPWAMSFTTLGGILGYLYGSIKESMAELEYSNRIKELFIDILHHDLASPLSATRINIELFLRDRKEEHLHSALKSLDEMWSIIEDSRNLAKLETVEPNFEEIDLAEIIDEIVDEFIPLAEEKDITIKLNINKNMPLISTKTIRLAISNLISNAIKYSPEGSTVEVSVVDEGKSYVISVSDQGEGISPENRERIFKRFERIEKGAIKGSGLGLAIVKRIADIHRGEIWIEDNKPKGSVFKLRIPKKQ